LAAKAAEQNLFGVQRAINDFFGFFSN